MPAVHWTNINTVGSTWDLGWCETNHHLLANVKKFGVTYDRRSDVAFHVASPRMFRPIRGKKNIVFSMWESKDFPEEHRPYLWNADHLIVPSEFCREVFQEFVNCQIDIVPLGVDHRAFPYKKRHWDEKESFQWLIVGSPSARKGYDAVEDAWNAKFYGREDCHLYCKLTTSDWEPAVARAKLDGYQEHYPGVVYKDNVVLDFRRLPVADLAETYHRSHGFVFPTAAEGFGLTLVEAMSTGLPCIVTRYSGVLDFTSDETVKYVSWAPYNNTYSTIDGLKTVLNSAMASVPEVIESMESIMRDYRRALQMGKRASRSIQHLTWESTGRRVAQAIISYIKTVDGK